jgi:hypothetical protein
VAWGRGQHHGVAPGQDHGHEASRDDVKEDG